MIKPILLTTFISLYALAGSAKDSTAPALHAPCAFTENKGQVTDQDHVPRADIQFKVAAAHGLRTTPWFTAARTISAEDATRQVFGLPCKHCRTPAEPPASVAPTESVA